MPTGRITSPRCSWNQPPSPPQAHPHRGLHPRRRGTRSRRTLRRLRPRHLLRYRRASRCPSASRWRRRTSHRDGPSRPTSGPRSSAATTACTCRASTGSSDPIDLSASCRSSAARVGAEPPTCIPVGPAIGGPMAPTEKSARRLDELDDAALVVEVVGRGPEAVEILWRRHGSAVLGVARRVTGTSAMAEEVLQEVFLRLWRAPERFDPSRGALRSFLLMEANGRAVDAVRSDVARRGLETRTRGADRTDADPVAAEVWDTA